MFDDLPYVDSGLDRVEHRRRDGAWIAEHLNAERSRFVPFWRGQNLFAGGPTPTAAALRGLAADPLIDAGDPLVLLGVDAAGDAWFAADVSAWEEDAVRRLGDGLRPSDLRRMSPLIPAVDAALLAYVRGIMYWHAGHRFCGRCGAPTANNEAGHLRTCTNEACGASHFPRTDPAVIMLVTRPGPDGGACLLGRQAGWPRAMYSTLAGFVEPGESLECAVMREVAEETGIAVDAVRYRASQPWPFPSSLMLGFRAEATADAEIRMNADELEDAQWFTRADIAAFDRHERKLPRGDSIARRLVEEWLAEGS